MIKRDFIDEVESLDNLCLALVLRILNHVRKTGARNKLEIDEFWIRKTFHLESAKEWEKAWSPLIQRGLVDRQIKIKGYCTYTIHLSKFSDYTDSVEWKINESKELVSDYGEEEFESILEEKINLFADFNRKKMRITVEGLAKDAKARNALFNAEHLLNLVNNLMRYHDRVIETVLGIYNDSYWGQKNADYLLAIARNKAEEMTVLDKTTMSSKKNKEKRKEGETKFAIDLALGKISKDNITYCSLLKNNVDKLREYWETGKKSLESTGRLEELSETYEWLK